MEKNYYNINELAVISGFTTRSLRNFITIGHLKGEKIDGIWQFTPEEIDEFLSNPNVMPGIKSKTNAVVYDFMADTEKKTNRICSILDFVMEDDEAIGRMEGDHFVVLRHAGGNTQLKKDENDVINHIRDVARIKEN